MMVASLKNCVVVLGPTASGKTSLGVRIARAHRGEIISADSRQVYPGLDIGAGKDLDEYTVEGETVPYHLIDIADLFYEFSVFEYQARFFEVFEAVRGRGRLPVVVGGAGLYLESVLCGYRMVEVPQDRALRARLALLSHVDLVERLKTLKPGLHNTTDLIDRDRIIRAIEIASHPPSTDLPSLPEVRPLILGTRWRRHELHRRIEKRLRDRLSQGMIGEVRHLLERHAPAEKLRFLGLEYRYVLEFLEGTIRNENDLFQKLNSAIRNFAKRQETWFRRMERNGTEIHWIDRADPRAGLRITSAAFPITRPVVKK